MTNLKAEGDFQQAILDYLNTIENPVFVEKVNNGNKGLEDCEDYIFSQMQKKAKHGRAVASDQEVFGLAVHYFEEDEIKKADKKAAPVKTVKVETAKTVEAPKVVKTSAAAELEGQLSLEW